MKNYVTKEEVAKKLDDVVVLDCRGYCHDEGAGQEAYAAGHIPGARFIPADWVVGHAKEHGGRHPLPDLEDLAARLGMVGVTRTSSIVIYDQGDGLGMSGRLWWTLRYLGADDVRILDGGFSQWVAAGLPVTTEVPEVAPEIFVPEVQSHLVVDRDAVLQWIASGEKVLVDVRAPERFRGEVEPLDPRPGRIPTAQNLFFRSLVNENGVCSPERLQELVAPLQAKGKDMVFYCGSGVSAPIALSVVEEAGIPPVLYLGSMSDWQSYPDAPLETGEA